MWKKTNKYLRFISSFLPSSYSDQAARMRKDGILRCLPEDLFWREKRTSPFTYLRVTFHNVDRT